MTLSAEDLRAISQLAYLDASSEEMDKLSSEVSAIIDFAQQLREKDTKSVAPLFHPMDMSQRMREDKVSEMNCLEQLAEIAPLFEESHYLVPTVIETDK